MASRTFPSFPSFDFSKLEMPKFEMPRFDMPSVDVPKVDVATITNAAKDAGYITVGLAVLAVQKAQVRRQELRSSVDGQVDSSKAQLAELVSAVEAGIAKLDTRLVAIESKLDDAVESVEKRLPAKAGAALGQAHEVVKVVRQQARTILNPAS